MYRKKLQKLSNRDRILECIFRNAPISRTLISEITEITPATTTATVTSLLEEGVLLEFGEELNEDNSIGRKRVALDINPTYAYSVGVEFNPKALCVCLTDLKGTVLGQHMLPYSDRLNAHITATIIEEIVALLKDSDVPDSKICGIGIAVPGHIDSQENMIYSSSAWNNFNIPELRLALPTTLVFENNVRCMAISQYLFHPETTPNSFAYFHVGMGIYCANFIDEELFLGNAYLSGEVGHTVVVPDGLPCDCKKHGCLETIASERALLENAKRLYEYDSKSILRRLVSSKDAVTIETIANAYAMGDELIRQYVTTALKYLGISTSNTAIIMNPEKVFLHGQLFNYPEISSELMSMTEKQLLFSDNKNTNTVEIIPCSSIDGAIGGAALSIMRCFLNIVPKVL